MFNRVSEGVSFDLNPFLLGLRLTEADCGIGVKDTRKIKILQYRRVIF